MEGGRQCCGKNPGSGAFLTSGSGNPGWVKNQDAESFKKQFSGLKYLNFLCGSGMEKIWIRDGKSSDPGSGINIPDPQHWWEVLFSPVLWIREYFCRIHRKKYGVK
jgi:hypothetical protein